MLIHDDVEMREYGKVLLRKAGYEALETTDGNAALEILDSEKPDLILADVIMPNLDGIEFIKIVRRNAGTREIPIVMVSARYGEDARVEGLEAGADDYLEKPFSAAELLARIKAHLRIARFRREAERAEKVVRDREIMQRIVSTQELERKRIARDLHDELGQSFTALRLKLERVKEICRNERVSEEIEKFNFLPRRLMTALIFSPGNCVLPF